MRLALILAIAPIALAHAQGKRVPTIDDLLNLKSAGGAVISPSGSMVAYTVGETDWKANSCPQPPR